MQTTTLAPLLKNKIFFLINSLIRTVLEKTKQNQGFWAELRAFKTSKLQYSRPDKWSEERLQVRTRLLCYV
jgi:hypothetical protein